VVELVCLYSVEMMFPLGYFEINTVKFALKY
jgi:hypothetical protein